MWYLLTLQLSFLNERSKRDASDESSSNDETYSDSSESNSDSDSGSDSSSDGNDSDSDSTRDVSDSGSDRSVTTASDDDNATTASSDDSVTTASPDDSVTTASSDESVTTASPDDSVTTASSDDSGTTASMNDCSLLSDYIEFDLPTIPELETGFSPDNIPSPTFILILNETVTFLELLESTPSLFANLSQVIADASGGLGRSVRRQLAADFVAVANDSCGLSLSPEQIDNVNVLLVGALPTFLSGLSDCDLLNQTIVEEAVAAAIDDGAALSLTDEFFEIDTDLLARRLQTGTINVFVSPTVDTATAEAQVVVNEFLFFVNDFCGIPVLSNVTLAQLDEFFALVVNSGPGQD